MTVDKLLRRKFDAKSVANVAIEPSVYSGSSGEGEHIWWNRLKAQRMAFRHELDLSNMCQLVNLDDHLRPTRTLESKIWADEHKRTSPLCDKLTKSARGSAPKESLTKHGRSKNSSQTESPENTLKANHVNLLQVPESNVQDSDPKSTFRYFSNATPVTKEQYAKKVSSVQSDVITFANGTTSGTVRKPPYHFWYRSVVTSGNPIPENSQESVSSKRELITSINENDPPAGDTERALEVQMSPEIQVLPEETENITFEEVSVKSPLRNEALQDLKQVFCSVESLDDFLSDGIFEEDFVFN